MSHAAKLNALTEDLITSLTNLPKQSRAFRNAKDTALRSLKSQNYARTNQFNVQNSLAGLIEKFQIKDREDLAYALDSRLKELGDLTAKWRPEILALFLELSDRPLEKSNVKDLELLKAKEEEKGITWEEIIAEDPLNEEGIWEDIDYAVESSDDGRYEEKDGWSDGDVSTKPSTVHEEEPVFDAKHVLIETDASRLNELAGSRLWRERAKAMGKHEITELQAIREALLMLQGLPTSLFKNPSAQRQVEPCEEYSITGANRATFQHALRELAELGSSLERLRTWTSQKQSVPLLQTFQSTLQRRLRDFDRAIGCIEQQLLTPAVPTVVSLIHVHDKVRVPGAPLLRLETMVAQLKPDSRPFASLELLFDQICIAQLTGDVEHIKSFANIFFECLHTYLRPVRRWMAHGELRTDDEVFFITEVNSTDLAGLWHDRYHLRRAANGQLYAPNFLHFASKKILNTGKSVIFLRELEHQLQMTQEEPPLDYESICAQQPASTLAPFSELFSITFEAWIRSKFSQASATLQQKLENECGLLRALDALELLYFSRDGSLFQNLADAFFEKMDHHGRWNDRFILTELVQSVFGQPHCVDVERINVRCPAIGKVRRGVQRLSTFVLEYVLPWPLLNIIRQSSFAVYQKILVLLLQIYRAKYVLRQLAPGYLRDLNSAHVTYSLRQRLVWFVDILQTHITFTVLNHETCQMRERLAKAEDIDDMSTIHANYIKRLQGQCLLSPNLAPIHEAITSLLDLCLAFASTLTSQNAAKSPASKNKPSSSYKKRRRTSVRFQDLALADSDTDTDEDEDHDNLGRYDADKKTPVEESSVEERVPKMLDQFERLLAFVVAGLRGVSRVDGEQSWEILMERLDWRRGGDGGTEG